MKRMLVGILCAFSFLQSSAQLRQQYILKDNWEFRSDKSGADAIWEKVTVPPVSYTHLDVYKRQVLRDVLV